ncbi:E3 SUMO-protein ligase ZBED1 [Frankliniella fusca]|uniref:E3 SUMO-protein ligase ZBED1 n=1 Tax=Frankliniella fusca TaxID=407009 RepID=A0AAE1GXU7_9NEOP|nr:E3 SUMO-protein ligase ZBED1 [Frankliniella fusca]
MHLGWHGVTKANAKDEKSLQLIKQSQPTSTATVNLEGDDDPDDPGSVQATSRTPARGTGETRRESLQQLPAASRVLGKRKALAPSASSDSQLTVETSFKRAASFQGGAKDAELRDALLFMEMRQNLPLSFSDGEGFKHFASKAVPLWKPPSRRTMTSLMEDKYEVLSTMVKKTLSELPSVCLTADCWTETHSTTSFLGVTVHYPIMTEMHTACVGLLKLEQRHTAEFLADQMLKFCEEWDIKATHVEAVITDNAENIKLAVKKAFGETKLLNCFDHTLNLIPRAALFGVKDGKPNVDGVPELIKKMKDIVTFSHMSGNFSNELKRIQVEQYNKTEGTTLRLLQDVVTRWGSTYKMIERFLTLQPVVVQAAAGFPDLDMLSAAELAAARIVMNILEPFHFATTEMSAEKHTTVSKILPMVRNIMKAELDAYLIRELVPISKNPLEVWEGIKQLYPYLHRVAQRKRTVPGTSVPSERMFSKAGDIMDDKGSRLTAKHLAQRLFLSSLDVSLWESPANI